ncbi:MAG: glycosyltransferase [Nitrospiraceae bacterium]|nr:MAG: glycosyltransferase [Nitrospiraceae bacterium]
MLIGETMKVSIVIINDNERLYLKRLLGSIDKKWKEYLEIIFADNCSNDSSAEAAGKEGIEKVISFDKKASSLAALYNAASEIADGQYILFVHSDIIFSQGFFEHLLCRLSIAPPDIMNFQVKYVDKTTSAENTIFWNHEEQDMYNLQLWGEPAGEGYFRIVSCSDCCFLVNRELASREKFNEAYGSNYFVHEFMLRQRSDAAIKFFDSAQEVEHYFVERHKQIKMIKHDQQIFIKNNFSVFQHEIIKRFEESRESHIFELESRLRQAEQQNQHTGNILNNMQGIIPTMEKLLARVHKEASSPEMLVEAGEICFGFENYDSARHFFEKALTVDPQNADALNNLGVVSLQRGNIGDARRYFMKALQVKPDYQEARVNLKSLSGAAS